MTGTTSAAEHRPIKHVERKYTSASGTHYILPSDDQERKRLAIQHQLLKRVYDGQLILPPVKFYGGENILDSGTGSGTWILDVAHNLPPSVKLRGIDIEPNLFPVADSVDHHPNVQFSVTSVTNLPKDWQNTFNFIYQRLLIGALQQSQWKLAISEMSRVLVPGGWVQLGEIGLWRGGPITERHRPMMQALYTAKHLLLDCTAQIPSMLEEAGFIDIHVKKRVIAAGKWAGQNGIDTRDAAIGFFRGVKTPVLKAGGLGFVSSEAEFDALLDGMEEEWDETPGSEVDFMYI